LAAIAGGEGSPGVEARHFRKAVVALSITCVLVGYYQLFGAGPDLPFDEVVTRARNGTLLTSLGGVALLVYSLISSR